MMKPIKLDLGCGKKKKAGFIGIDVVHSDEVDLVCDVDNGGIPLFSGVAEKVFSFHFLEHVQNTRFVLEEIYRVLKPGGIAEIVVPHFSNIGAYHWTHKTFWNARGLDMLQPEHPHNFYCPDVAFRLCVRNIEFTEKREYHLTIIERLASLKRGLVYEWLFASLIRAYQVRVILEKVE